MAKSPTPAKQADDKPVTSAAPAPVPTPKVQADDIRNTDLTEDDRRQALAKALDIGADDIFAVGDHGTYTNVVTIDGRKLRVEHA